MSWEGLKAQIDVAMGRKKADTLLINGKVFNVFTSRFFESPVAIYRGIIVGWDDYEADEVIDLEGGYLLPGFVDAHIHIESTLMTPGRFAMAVLPHGTTTVIADPHEIANVMGIDGLSYMLSSTASIPMNVFFMLPSCVPSSPFETSGARLDYEDLSRFADHDRVLGLAEVMDTAGLLMGDEGVLRKVSYFSKSHVDGHAPGLRGKGLNAYLAGGISTDHESTALSEAEEKLEKGLFVMIREGTTEKNLDALLPLVRPESSARFSFVSDDIHPVDIYEDGHIDRILKKAVDRGMDIPMAIRMVTINPAEHYGIKGIGAIAPGYRADLVLLSDLKDLTPSIVFKDGIKVAQEGEVLYDYKGYPAPYDCMNLHIKDVSIEVRGREGDIRVIEVLPDQILTRALRLKPRIVDGLVVSDTERDILKIAVFERHRGTGRAGIGFVKGFGLKRGAMASSFAHDAHNLIAVGVDDRDIILAVKSVAGMGGGLCVVCDGKILAGLPLPVAGLMSDRPLREIVEGFRGLIEGAESIGSCLKDPFMTLSFISLPVIPELRLTDMGIVDVEKGDIVPLFV